MIKKAEAQQTIMSNKFQPWWLRFCIASFLLLIPVKPHSTSIYEGEHVRENQISLKISPPEEIEITCSTYNNPEYLESIFKINATPTFNRLVISKCPVPDIISLFEILSTLKIPRVKGISFQSSESSSANLQPDTFKNLETVEISNLQNSQIYNVMVALEELNLSDNRLNSIPEKLFESLKKLRKLDLQRNNITTLDRNVFRFIPTLTYLNLCGNRLTTVSTSVFDSLTNLTILEVCNNNITYLDDKLFNNLQNLEEINLSNNRLTSLPRSSFDKCTKLKILRLNGNLLDVLPEKIFKYTESLEILDLSNNQLENLNEKIFNRLTSLSTLRLNENNISVLNWDIFHKLTSLTELNLSRNKLKVLDNKTFLALILLETIDLSYNQLTLEEAKLGVLSPFITCVNLKYLRLQHNLLTRVYIDWWLLFNMLEELDLSYNQLKHLTTDDFVFNTSNATINYGNNPLQIIDLDGLENKVKPPCSRSDFFLKNYPKRPSHNNKFNLENSHLKCDCNALSLAKYFQQKMDPDVYQLVNLSSHGLNCHSPDTVKNTSLQKVNLTDLKCSLKQLYPEEAGNCPEKCDCHYRSVDKANIVNCTNVGMTEFPKKVPFIYGSKVELLFGWNKFKSTDGLSALTVKGNVIVISLSHNELQNFDDIELPNTLEVLKLDNNRISSLKQETIETFRSIESLRNISLHGNPWECNCGTRYFQNFIRYHRTTLWIEGPYAKIICSNVNHPVVHEWEEEACPTTFVLILKCLAISGFLIIPAITLYYKYKRKIKLWMFTHEICLWLVTEKEIDKDKLYDAFVSFSHKDQHFVDQKLIPELEENGDHTFKLCIHYRDFVVGEYIPSQIIYSVENSRRTIIILTPNFLQSIWARMEFRMAHLQAIKERCSRVIVILLEEVDDEQLDPELKAYIGMNTYVKWGDSSFWEKLRYALPHPQIKCSKKNRRIGTDILHEIELREMQKGE